jgi:hypothetical protein
VRSSDVGCVFLLSLPSRQSLCSIGSGPSTRQPHVPPTCFGWCLTRLAAFGSMLAALPTATAPRPSSSRGPRQRVKCCNVVQRLAVNTRLAMEVLIRLLEQHRKRGLAVDREPEA